MCAEQNLCVYADESFLLWARQPFITLLRDEQSRHGLSLATESTLALYLPKPPWPVLRKAVLVYTKLLAVSQIMSGCEKKHLAVSRITSTRRVGSDPSCHVLRRARLVVT